VKNFFDIELDEDSLHYERFITHMMYLARRIFKKQQLDDNEAEYMSMIRNLYPEDYKCSYEISDYIEKEFKRKLTEEELMYLTLHIKRVRTDEN